MTHAPFQFQRDIDAVNRIKAVPKILDVVCDSTGMRFAAVGRIRNDQWTVCTMKDDIALGLSAGAEMDLAGTLCGAICDGRPAVAIDNVDEDEEFRFHPTPRNYGFRSYIATPIVLPDGRLFGTLCAIDRKPARVNNAATIGMFSLFSELIAIRLDAMTSAGSSPEERSGGLDHGGRDAEDDLAFLLDRLERCAAAGEGLYLPPRFSRVLGAALEDALAEAGGHGAAEPHPFRVVVADNDNAPASTIARVAGLSLARAILEVAARRNPGRRIMLFKGASLVEQV